METFAKYTIFAGIGLIIIGAIMYGLARLNIPVGRLPGDIFINGENVKVYIPLATSIILSIVLTILLNVIGRFLKK